MKMEGAGKGVMSPNRGVERVGRGGWMVRLSAELCLQTDQMTTKPESKDMESGKSKIKMSTQ